LQYSLAGIIKNGKMYRMGWWREALGCPLDNEMSHPASLGKAYDTACKVARKMRKRAGLPDL